MPGTATPDDFFAAAMRLLADAGLPALRIGRLCSEVGVTSGSFYHHFGGWDAFVGALLAHWAREEVDRIVELVRGEDDAAERVALMKRLALTVPHEAERAIRRWAGTDPVVAAVQRQVDDRRRHALGEVLLPLVGDEVLSTTLADVGMGLLVGHQQIGPADTDLAALLDQFELLVRVHALRAFDARISGSTRSATIGPR